MKIDGRCYCGWVTFKAEADPERRTGFCAFENAANVGTQL
jgi:hypothetical protein